MSSEWPPLYPAFIAITYYAFVIFVAELSRKIVDYFLKKNGNAYAFFIELIAVAQQCTCVYENGIMIRHYGAPGFFGVVFGILLVTSRFNRGAFVSPMWPIEMLFYGTMGTERFLFVLSAQALGGLSAYRLASSLWYYTFKYSTDHARFYRNLPCTISYKVPFYYALAYEIIGCFLIRLLIPRVSESYKRFVIPVIFASFLSFALSYIGVPGLNPVTVSSRLQGCPGLDLQWFLITYWAAPVIGWMAAAALDRSRKSAQVVVNVKSSKKQK